jgi:hypothetical protein
VARGVWVLCPMVGTNCSIHHLDSIPVPVDMIPAGLWEKCNWEICQHCWELCTGTWGHFAIIGIVLLHHHYNCCNHRYDNQLQLGFCSYRIERIVIICAGTDCNILLFVVNNVLCFTEDELRYIRLILNGGT